MDVNKDYYKVLEINQNANIAQIKRAYRKLALKWHPDRVPNDQKVYAESVFKEITQAYYILGHPERRKTYNQQIKDRSSVFNQSAPFSPRGNEDVLYEEFLKRNYKSYKVPNIDWHEILGGTWSKILAVILCVIYYLISYKKFGMVPFSRLQIYTIFAYSYIIIEPIRDYILKFEDFSLLLLLSWCAIVMSYLILFMKCF